MYLTLILLFSIMEVSRGIINLHIKENTPPANVKAIGMATNGNIIFTYTTCNSKIKYCYYSPNSMIQTYLFFELLNNISLWLITYNVMLHNSSYSTNHSYYEIIFVISIKSDFINNYIKTSLAVNLLINNEYSKISNFTNTDFTNKSIISYFDPITPSNNFKVKLYNYQQRTLAKMIEIENNQINSTINYTFNINFHGKEILFDPISNSQTDTQLKFNIKTTGGVLSDEMGLGKTISSIALITENPAPNNLPNITMSKITNNNKINSNATVILCPSHLAKQWESEIRKCNAKLKILTIITKNNYNDLIFDDFINTDIIITTHQFIMNFKFYPTLHYNPCTAASFNFENRNEIVKNYLDSKITKLEWKEIKLLQMPIFEFFNFHRLILDEGHEIFGELLGSIALSKYMSRWVSNIDANYFWYVSGTPFVNYTSFINCAKFINLQLEDKNRNLLFDYSDYSTNNSCSKIKDQSFLMNFMNKEYIWNSILDKICVRHRKVDVENQIQIPEYEERLIWLRFTDLERKLYDAKKNKVSNQFLQQLCCHPLVVDSVKKIFGDVEVDLAVMQDKLILYHKNNYDTYANKLSKLDSTRQEYHMLKKSYETQMSESKYLFTILEKMKQPELIEQENCSICLDCLDNPTLTACGHLFCYDCVKMCLETKKNCPMCKIDLKGKDLLVMNLKKDSTEDINPLIKKYGSKLGKIISIIRHIASQEDTRIIIFSQWDDMLSLIGKTLAENEISNCFVKGNVWSRNSAINKFKIGKTSSGSDNKVIMLSLKNAASGTNLTEATHIFFVEPIDADKEEIKAIESQAIARACRVGQKQKIILVRILIEDSIEEDIYRKNYNSNVNINFDDQGYFIKNNISEEINNSESTNETKNKVKRVSKNKIPVEIEV